MKYFWLLFLFSTSNFAQNYFRKERQILSKGIELYELEKSISQALDTVQKDIDIKNKRFQLYYFGFKLGKIAETVFIDIEKAKKGIFEIMYSCKIVDSINIQKILVDTLSRFSNEVETSLIKPNLSFERFGQHCLQKNKELGYRVVNILLNEGSKHYVYSLNRPYQKGFMILGGAILSENSRLGNRWRVEKYFREKIDTLYFNGNRSCEIKISSKFIEVPDVSTILMNREQSVSKIYVFISKKGIISRFDVSDNSLIIMNKIEYNSKFNTKY